MHGKEESQCFKFFRHPKDVLVDPEVGDKVVAEHMVPAFELDPIVHGSNPEEDADIRDDDLEELGRLEKVACEGVEI